MTRFRRPAQALCAFFCAAGLSLILWVVPGCSKRNPAPNVSPSERVLFSFERPTMLPMVGGTARRAIVAEHATHGKRCLRLSIAPKTETVILDSTAFPMDWRGWTSLKVDMYRDAAPIRLNLRLTDKQNRRHWVWSTRVEPGANTLEYDLSQLRDKIDLSAVTELMWYAEEASGRLYMDHIRLSKGISAENPNI